MRVDTVDLRSVSPRSQTTIADKARVVELITELSNAGLVSAEMGDDGVMSYELTPAGVTAARQMAMHAHAHALVLLGALVGSTGYPN